MQKILRNVYNFAFVEYKYLEAVNVEHKLTVHWPLL